MDGATSGLARALRDRSRGYRGGGEVRALPQGRGPAVRAGPDGHIQGAALRARLRMGALFLRRAHTESAAGGGGLARIPYAMQHEVLLRRYGTAQNSNLALGDPASAMHREAALHRDRKSTRLNSSH